MINYTCGLTQNGTHRWSSERINLLWVRKEKTAKDVPEIFRRKNRERYAVTKQGTHGTHLILAELGPAQGLVAAGARAELGRHVALEDTRLVSNGLCMILLVRA